MVHSYRPSAMALKTLLSTALIRGSPSFLPLPAQNRMVLHHVRITGSRSSASLGASNGPLASLRVYRPCLMMWA